MKDNRNQQATIKAVCNYSNKERERERSQFPNWKIYKETRLMKEEKKNGGCGKSREKGKKERERERKKERVFLKRR